MKQKDSGEDEEMWFLYKRPQQQRGFRVSCKLSLNLWKMT